MVAQHVKIELDEKSCEKLEKIEVEGKSYEKLEEKLWRARLEFSSFCRISLSTESKLTSGFWKLYIDYTFDYTFDYTLIIHLIIHWLYIDYTLIHIWLYID